MSLFVFMLRERFRFHLKFQKDKANRIEKEFSMLYGEEKFPKKKGYNLANHSLLGSFEFPLNFASFQTILK